MMGNLTDSDWAEIDARGKLTENHPVIASIHKRLEDGRLTMESMKTDIAHLRLSMAENTSVTQTSNELTKDFLAVFKGAQAAFKAIEFLARVVKAVGIVAAPFVFFAIAIKFGWLKAIDFVIDWFK